MSASVHRGALLPFLGYRHKHIYLFFILAPNVRGHDMIDWFTSLKRELLFRVTHLNVQLGLLLLLINIVTKKVNNLTIL